MFKKTMTFDNLDGEEVTQTFYFNYNKKEIAELIEFQDLEGKLKLLKTPTSESGLTEQENTKMAYDIFQDLILDAYGEKGEDNVTFVKNERTREYWRSHVAFPELIFEMLENPSLGGEFIENCLPQKLVSQAKAELAKDSDGKLDGKTLHEMVQEADRRQNDPETAIKPGDTSLVENLSSDNKPLRYEQLDEEAILSLNDEAFASLDPQKLNQQQLQWAMARKLRS